MKVGIVVHSKTGTTLRFGKIFAEELEKKGHSVDTLELKIDPEDYQGKTNEGADFKILNLPDVSDYDVLLLGGPVWGFSASPVIMRCIRQIEGIKGKKVLPFVTQGFPFAGMGGNRALSQMTKEAKAKGAKVLPGRSVQKMFRNIDRNMKKAASEVPSILK